MRARLISTGIRLWRDESGSTAIEYALIAAGVGGFIAATIWGLGSDVRTGFYDKLAAML